MSKYTDEMLDTIVTEYTEKRDAGELNRDIMDYLIDFVAVEYDVEVNAASLRAKLGGVETAEPGVYTYRKDTEAEKEILAARTSKPKAGKKVTKKDLAVQIFDALGMSTELAVDLARAKTDTLKALIQGLQDLDSPVPEA